MLRQQQISPTRQGQRFFSTASTTVLMDRSMYKPWIAITSFAPVTRYFRLTWDFCGADGNSCKSFPLSARTSYRTNLPEKSKRGHSSMRMSPVWMPQSAIWKDLESRWPAMIPAHPLLGGQILYER